MHSPKILLQSKKLKWKNRWLIQNSKFTPNFKKVELQVNLYKLSLIFPNLNRIVLFSLMEMVPYLPKIVTQ